MGRAEHHVAPRLLTAAQAREYLSGCNPASIVPPVRIGRHVRWDRLAIDAQLDEMRGAPAHKDEATPEEALAEWKSSHGALGRRP